MSVSLVGGKNSICDLLDEENFLDACSPRLQLPLIADVVDDVKMPRDTALEILLHMLGLSSIFDVFMFALYMGG